MIIDEQVIINTIISSSSIISIIISYYYCEWQEETKILISSLPFNMHRTY